MTLDTNQSVVHKASVDTSLIKTRFPEITGCVQVAVSATLYRVIGSKRVRLCRSTSSSPSSSSEKMVLPARTIAACAACLGSLFHSTLPVSRSSAKYSPLLRCDNPYNTPLTTTASLRCIETSSVCQMFSVVHLPSRGAATKAVTPLPRPISITMFLYRIGVCDVVVEGVVYGRCQRSWPVAADTPTKYFCVNVTT